MHHRATSCDVWPHFKGTFGDYFYLYPNHMVFKVPDDLSDDLVVGVNCAMAQVTAGLDLAGLANGESVVIQGAGGLGLYAIAVARERGAGQIIVVDGVAGAARGRGDVRGRRVRRSSRLPDPGAADRPGQGADRRLGRRRGPGAGRLPSGDR